MTKIKKLKSNLRVGIGSIETLVDCLADHYTDPHHISRIRNLLFKRINELKKVIEYD